MAGESVNENIYLAITYGYGGQKRFQKPPLVIAWRMSSFVYTILITILSFLLPQTVHDQEKISNHSIRYFENDTERTIAVSEISIKVGGEFIQGIKSGIFYQFPIIDSVGTFELLIETNKMKFHAGPFQSWFLNNGSRIILGKITKPDKLLSIAEYNGMEVTDDGYDDLARRFFIVGKSYTIDIDDFENTNRLDYLIINPHQEGDGSYVLTQKSIR